MTRPPASALALDSLDRKIINRLQDGMPVVADPYRLVAMELGCTEAALLQRIARLLEHGVLTRFGPFFDVEAMGGAFCLCAMAVPAERFDSVCACVNALPEVAHNYERAHALNMWFVLATETEDGIDRAAGQIEQQTGLRVLQFPKLQEFFIGFRVAA